MSMTNAVREMAFKGEPSQSIRKQARKDGMRTLFEDGLVKAIRGITTIDEVLRITQREMVVEAPPTLKKPDQPPSAAKKH
jgi:type IV pilus assembly protein PilB